MTVLRFPARNIAAIFVAPAPSGGWLTTAPRGNAWLSGDFAQAVGEASWLGENYGLPVRITGVSL